MLTRGFRGDEILSESKIDSLNEKKTCRHNFVENKCFINSFLSQKIAIYDHKHHTSTYNKINLWKIWTIPPPLDKTDRQ